MKATELPSLRFTVKKMCLLVNDTDGKATLRAGATGLIFS
jgi:hypothetical protein